MAPTPANWATSLRVTRPVLRRFSLLTSFPFLGMRAFTLRQKRGTDYLLKPDFTFFEADKGQDESLL